MLNDYLPQGAIRPNVGKGLRHLIEPKGSINVNGHLSCRNKVSYRHEVSRPRLHDKETDRPIRHPPRQRTYGRNTQQ